MLAGRKLLLADDSITIQKVVALTFADEGVEVLSVSNGRDAIDQVAQFQPDIALVDVFMPQVNGYEVCEYIKQNDQLKHIPVMLLVGSFEPFDEAEARRVGADDTLTKPFQSIRNLIDKVGSLVSARPAEEQIPTAELPKPDIEDASHEPDPELLSEAEINLVTADTQPLPAEMSHLVESSATRSASAEGVVLESPTKLDEERMETQTTAGAVSEPSHEVRKVTEELLDLGGLGRETTSSSEEFVLDLDLDEAPDDSTYQPSAYVRPTVYKSPARDWNTSAAASALDVATADQLARTQEFPASISAAAKESRVEAGSFAEPQASTSKAPAASAQSVSAEGISAEVIDAIARRAVEHLSEKVVREIAWEVVPDLAELLIKRQLEENKS